MRNGAPLGGYGAIAMKDALTTTMTEADVDLSACQAPRKSSTGRHPPRSSTSNYGRSTKPVLQPPVEPKQCTSRTFRDFYARHGVRPSVGGTGIYYDCAVAESSIATLQKEPVHLRPWPTLGRLRTALFSDIETYYNRQRRHSTLGHLSPEQYEQAIDEEARRAA